MLGNPTIQQTWIFLIGSNSQGMISSDITARFYGIGLRLNRNGEVERKGGRFIARNLKGYSLYDLLMAYDKGYAKGWADAMAEVGFY